MPELTVKLVTDWGKSPNPYQRCTELAADLEHLYKPDRGVSVVGWSSQIVDQESKLLSVDVVMRFDSSVYNDARKRIVGRMLKPETNLHEAVTVYGFEEKR